MFFVGSGLMEFWSSLAIVLFIFYFINFLTKLNDTIAFREFILVLYGVNFLLAPAVLMNIDTANTNISFYKIRLSKEEFFQLSIPAMILLHVGLFAIKTTIFNRNFNLVKVNLMTNEPILKRWVIIGIICGLFVPFFVGSEIGFLLYLVSMLKYVGGFGLFTINKRSYKLYIIAVFFFEISQSLGRGMFGESSMWLSFFAMFWFYLTKPSALVKTIIISTGFIGFILLQNSKNEYREKVWSEQEEGSIATLLAASEDKRDDVFELSSIATSLNRLNQGWILSSVVDRMKVTKDFQELNMFGLYFEAALLPRILAPDKLTAGNKEIFNRFSGHTIEQGTSMGLGWFADGYIAYGYFGTLGAAFLLGIVLCSIFKFVERWTKISPFFIFFIFPILNYAIRPDCETQTIMGHIVKAIFVYSIIIYFTQRNMRRAQVRLQEKMHDFEEELQKDETKLIPSIG